MSVLGGRTAAGTPRRADIQGLRAIAVLLVVAFHAGLPVPGGFMGVDVFFAISGFVMTTMLLNELESSTGSISPASTSAAHVACYRRSRSCSVSSPSSNRRERPSAEQSQACPTPR
jgi:hypothetical protein